MDDKVKMKPIAYFIAASHGEPAAGIMPVTAKIELPIDFPEQDYVDMVRDVLTDAFIAIFDDVHTKVWSDVELDSMQAEQEKSEEDRG